MNNRFKYPRTKHFHFSECIASDDKRNDSDDFLKNKEVIVTIKLDGENTTIYNDFSHARSLDSDKESEDRRWIELYRQLKISTLPSGYRLCGENLFYKHTVLYKNLKTYFYLFSIWLDDKCLSWNDTLKMCDDLNIETVPVIYRGIYDKKLILKLFNEYNNIIKSEGFVVRLSESFNIENFENSIAKFVSKDFVIPNKHWKYSAKTRNEIIYDDYWDIK